MANAQLPSCPLGWSPSQVTQVSKAVNTNWYTLKVASQPTMTESELVSPDVEALLEVAGDAYTWVVIPYGDRGVACLAIVTTDVEFTLGILLKRLAESSKFSEAELEWLRRHAERVETATARWLAWPALTAVDLDEEAPRIQHGHEVANRLGQLTDWQVYQTPGYTNAYQNELDQLQHAYAQRRADLEQDYRKSCDQLDSWYGRQPQHHQQLQQPVLFTGSWPLNPSSMSYVDFDPVTVEVKQTAAMLPPDDLHAQFEQRRREELDKQLRAARLPPKGRK